MSFTAACYTRGCGWKRTGARAAAEALRWGQRHALEMKWRTGQAHETTCSVGEAGAAMPEGAAALCEELKRD
jgi:hypothetical protein